MAETGHPGRRVATTERGVSMPGRVEGKVVFITGVARGQGRSHALTFAREGADIIGVDIPGSEEALAETAAEIERFGRRSHFATGDVRDEDALADVVSTGVEHLGNLDVVCANAGIIRFGSRVQDISAGDWGDVIDINLTGVFNTVKASIPALLDNGGGSITLMGSAASLKGFSKLGAYAAAKHGLLGLMKTLALELGPKNIRVNAVVPGNVNTGMIQNDDFYKLFLPKSDTRTAEEFEAAAASQTVLPVSLIEPEDVSNAILFLSSAEARYITGTVLTVDAGMTLR
ncbi:mycofactocin-coupled SDR family oxidoreductase [Herbiconiux sp. P17]|uniref:mycofactocin-coupled SDR family oxidoreductase n=1 Tax=Herbiconiux wuyangfengii TaxID=3342794 RepID=UPI0035B92C9C